MIASKVRKPVPLSHLNAWSMLRQFLDRSFGSKNLVDLIKSIGWIYSPGCSAPDLSPWGRMRRFRAKDVNRLVVDDHQVLQLETLRGCTMLVPRDQANIAVRIRTLTLSELIKYERQQMCIPVANMEKMKRAILKSLHSGPKTSEQLQQMLPPDLIRDCGADLKRIGLTNSLSLGINLLKEEGKVLKQQSKRRLDTMHYSFVLTSSILPEADPFSLRLEEACAQLADQYFKAEAPARAKDFAWWAGINVTDAIRGGGEIKPKLVPVSVEGTADEFLISESELDDFFAFEPQDFVINFIPYRYTYLKGQREILNRFISSEHADKLFSRWKGKLINDPLATIIVNGRVVGVWEWSEDGDDIDLLLFDSIAKSAERAINKRVSELAGCSRSNVAACCS